MSNESLNFMINPLSLAGQVEANDMAPITFATDNSEAEQDWTDMIYVINLEDGGGQEFFLADSGTLINLSTNSDEQPQEFKAYKLVAKKIEQLRERYPASCHIYALERKEFDQRRLLLQAPPQTPAQD